MTVGQYQRQHHAQVILVLLFQNFIQRNRLGGSDGRIFSVHQLRTGRRQRIATGRIFQPFVKGPGKNGFLKIQFGGFIVHHAAASE